MKCPECEKTGSLSRVYPRGGSLTSLVGGQVFSDQEGKKHAHYPGTTSHTYVCSNRHQFVVESGYVCWCGWKSTSTKIKTIPYTHDSGIITLE